MKLILELSIKDTEAERAIVQDVVSRLYGKAEISLSAAPLVQSHTHGVTQTVTTAPAGTPSLPNIIAPNDNPAVGSAFSFGGNVAPVGLTPPTLTLVTPQPQVQQVPTLPNVNASTIASAPPVVNAVSTQQPVASVAGATKVEVDKNGTPWDARIHSTPAKLTTKNEWRAKRGVEDTYVAQVTEELRRIGAVNAGHGAQVVQAVQPVTSATPPAIQPQAQAETAFTKLIMELTPHVQSGALSETRLTAIAATLGLPSVGALQEREDLIPAFVEAINNGVAAGQ